MTFSPGSRALLPPSKIAEETILYAGAFTLNDIGYCHELIPSSKTKLSNTSSWFSELIKTSNSNGPTSTKSPAKTESEYIGAVKIFTLFVCGVTET